VGKREDEDLNLMLFLQWFINCFRVLTGIEMGLVALEVLLPKCQNSLAISKLWLLLSSVYIGSFIPCGWGAENSF